MKVYSIDRGDKVRQGVQFRFALAPVVVCPPIARELLNGRELHALRLIRDSLLVGPSRRGDAFAKIDKLLFRKIDVKGMDGLLVVRSRGGS